MDAIKNPFSPGAGSPPPEMVGREGILEQARILLGRIKEQRPEKSILLTGLRGVGKPYRERYRLTNFGRGGFVRLARTAKVPIIPVAIVGAEEAHPVVAKLTRIARPLGLPYIPITPTFPLLGPLGLLPVPAKWSIQIGEAISPISQPDRDTLEVAEQVRSVVDRMIADLLLERRSIFFG